MNSPEFWEEFLTKMDLGLSQEFDAELGKKKKLFNSPIIELASGVFPSSDVLRDKKKLRVLVDFINLENKINTASLSDNPRLVQTDLTKFANNEPTDFGAVVNALDHIGSIVISSGVNYFDWKNTLKKLMPKMKSKDVIAIHSIILDEPLKDTRIVMDEEHRPRSAEEITDFLNVNGFSIIHRIDSVDVHAQPHLGVIAQKV